MRKLKRWLKMYRKELLMYREYRKYKRHWIPLHPMMFK